MNFHKSCYNDHRVILIVCTLQKLRKQKNNLWSKLIDNELTGSLLMYIIDRQEFFKRKFVN